MEIGKTLLPVIIILVAGLLATALARPLRLPAIFGFLVAGVLVGPDGLGLIEESKTTHLVAELGVAFLLFEIGMHFSLKEIWEGRRDILLLAPLQCLLCAIGFGLVAHFGFGLMWQLSVIVGAALALSSTAVVARILRDRNQTTCPLGRSSLAILIFQDILAIFLLILAASMTATAEKALSAIGLALINTIIAIGVALVLGRYVMRPLFALIAKTRNDEAFTAIALLLVLAAGAATASLGLSLTLGAFLAGMIVGATPYRAAIQSEIKPFQALLLSFFFISVGMTINVDILASYWLSVFGLVAVFLLIKTGMIVLAARANGWSKPGSIQLGFLLAQGSELTFVILAMPAVRDGLGETAASILIAAVALSLAVAPPFSLLGMAVARRVAKAGTSPSATPAEPVQGPIVIVGMGEVGRRLADALKAHAVPFVALERDPDAFMGASADGYDVAFGDAGDVRLIASIAEQSPRAIVITAPRYEVSKDITPIVKERWPDLTRYVAVRTQTDADRHAALGIHPVRLISRPQGLELAADVLRFVGIEKEAVLAWVLAEQERALGADFGADPMLEIREAA